MFKRRVLPFLLCLLITFSVLRQDIVGNGQQGGANYPDVDPVYTKGTGGGIIYEDYPGFAVSLSEATFTDPILEDDNDSVVKKKYEDYYKNRFPSQKQSIYFIHPNAYSSTYPVSWYNHSTGKIVTPKNNNKIKKMITNAENTGNLNYIALYNKIKKVKDQDEFYQALGKGEWKKLINKSGEDNLVVWSYFLKNKASDIDTKLQRYLKITNIPGGSTTHEKELMQAAAWIDLVATLYVLSPTGEQKEYYDNYIETYLQGDSKILGTHPGHISITPVATVRTKNIEPEYRYISAMDYIQYIYGATPEGSLEGIKHLSNTKKDYSESSDGWKELIDSSVVKSLKDSPKKARVTSLTGNAARSNGFNWGMKAVLGARLSTSAGKPVWSSITVDGFLQLLKFKGGMYGFVIAYPGSQHIYQSPRGRFGITLDGEKKEIIPGDQEVIREPIQIELELKQSKSNEVNAWNDRLSQKFASDYPKIKITLERETPAVRKCDSSNPAIGEDNPKLYTTDSKFKGDGIEREISVAELKSLFSGKSKIHFKDETALFKIEPKSDVTFKYKATVSIILSATEMPIQLRAEKGEASKIYSRPDSPPDIVGYTSQPSYWSEIKNGEPGNETFEAMAGVPTTRNLYFASGGSEFIVETQFEYVKDTETTRTYRSYFTAVDSEFKQGDNAKTATLGGQTVDLHNGGTYSKTWTGTTAWTGSGGVSGASAWHTDSWNDGPYNSAMTEANNFAAKVNGTTLSHTGASDGILRSKTGWGASVSGSNPHNSGSHSNGQEYEAPSYDSKGKQTSPGQPFIAGTYTPGTSNSWTITVTWTVPAHCICGPSCCYTLPEVEDTWTQKITYDHMKIKVARVWKLDQAAVNGMTEITGTDEFKATVISGEPTIFYNQADPDPSNPNDKDGNDSRHGRLRYSLEPDMHDEVVWNEGPRTNKDDGNGKNGVSTGVGHANPYAKGIGHSNGSYSNTSGYNTTFFDSVDKDTVEYKKFNQRRLSDNKATVVSDFLILQTSSGDQSILYFQKESGVKHSQDNFEKVAATRQEMWDNNPLSFAKEKPDAVNIGSYNGKYYTPFSKYSNYTAVHVATIFDTVPAGLNRTPRPSSAMRLVNDKIDIIDTIPNRYYETGISSVFYRNILDIGGTEPSVYSESAYNSHFSATGIEYESAYADGYSKVNDIVVHNPVSTEFAMVIPLDESRDQRIDSSKVVGGNLQDPIVEIIRRLNPNHSKQNLIYNGDAEAANSNGTLINWKTWTSSPGKATFTRRITSDWKISGSSSFEIISTPNLDIPAVYYTDVPGIAGDSYSFSGKMGAHRCVGYFYIEAFNSSGTSLGTFSSNSMDNDAAVKTLFINFKAPAGTAKLRVHIVKGKTLGYVSGYSEHVFADDLALNDNTTTSWQTISYETEETTEIENPYYVPEHTIPNPDYIPSYEGGKTSFNYTGSYQIYTAPLTGVYTFEVWGAQGGNVSYNYSSGMQWYHDRGCTYEGETHTTTSTSYCTYCEHSCGWLSSYGSTYSANGTGGYGGYSKGDITLKKGDTIYIYIGGQGSTGDVYGYHAGGYNGGGNGSEYSGGGGGATDIRLYSQGINDRVIVAGGGGGAQVYPSNRYVANGGVGGGLIGGNGTSHGAWSTYYITTGGTQSNGGTGTYWNLTGGLGYGGSYNSSYQGGGGGGYYGGAAGTYYGYSGGGGSSFIGSVNNSITTPGIRPGNGCAAITAPTTDAIGSPTIVVPAVGTPTIKSVSRIRTTIDHAPDDWYEDIIVTTPATNPIKIPNSGTYTPGNFINLDHGFQIYFPNRGDFYGDGSYGIGYLSSMRGKGFVNGMNTTEWTKEKYVSFQFNAIYNGVMYSAGENIPLDINDSDGIYDLYCPLASSEAISSEVTFKVIANNGDCIDNDYMANKERGSYIDARHSGIKRANIDLVGRIGNLILEDTEDFRFSNLFKRAKSPLSWIVPRVVKAVDVGKQNRILGSGLDIRGESVSANNHWLDTYGALDFADANPVSFPLTPDKNNIAALQRQPLRIGYKGLMDVQTIGNYSNGAVEIVPYYYWLNLKTGVTKPVDIYMSVNGNYKPINIFGATNSEWNPDSVYNNTTNLNWEEENARRNYTAKEKVITEKVAETYKTYETDSEGTSLPTPIGTTYTYGNNQVLQLTGRNRTFIGTSTVYGNIDTNPGNVLNEMFYGLQAQRWHFTSGLPSSAVAVEHGKSVSKKNIDAMRSNTSVLLMCLDIKSIGDTYVLQYSGYSQNSNIVIAKTQHNLSSIPYPIVCVYSTQKTSADDLDIRGTH